MITICFFIKFYTELEIGVWLCWTWIWQETNLFHKVKSVIDDNSFFYLMISASDYIIVDCTFLSQPVKSYLICHYLHQNDDSYRRCLQFTDVLHTLKHLPVFQFWSQHSLGPGLFLLQSESLLPLSFLLRIGHSWSLFTWPQEAP